MVHFKHKNGWLQARSAVRVLTQSIHSFCGQSRACIWGLADGNRSRSRPALKGVLRNEINKNSCCEGEPI